MHACAGLFFIEARTALHLANTHERHTAGQGRLARGLWTGWLFRLLFARASFGRGLMGLRWHFRRGLSGVRGLFRQQWLMAMAIFFGVLKLRWLGRAIFGRLRGLRWLLGGRRAFLFRIFRRVRSTRRTWAGLCSNRRFQNLQHCRFLPRFGCSLCIVNKRILHTLICHACS